jgi:hypothetical protein
MDGPKRRQKSSAIALFATVAIAFAACRDSRQPEMEDLLGSRIDQAGYSEGDHIDILRTAPIVILATVIYNDPIGRPREASRVRNYRVQLRKVVVRVEEELRRDLGDYPRLAGGNVEFYYYAATEPRAYQPFHKFFYHAAPGGRYLFFLMRHGDTRRSVGDVGRYSIPVFSGRPRPSSKEHLSYGARISEILLSLGEGFDEENFAADLWRVRGIADQVGSHEATIRLLKELRKGPLSVRSAACRELERGPKQYDCSSP